MSGCARRDLYPAYEPPDRNLRPITAKAQQMPRSPSFNAADARALVQKALDINGEIARQETQVLLERIEAAAKAGETTITTTLVYKHRDLIVKRLKSLNFTVVTHSDQRDGDYTTVSW